MLPNLLSLDIDLFWLINNHHTPTLDAFFGIVTNMGNFWFLAPILAGIVLMRTPPQQRRSTLIFCIVSLSIAGIINTTFKQTLLRPRPLRYFQTVDQPVPAASEPHFKQPLQTTQKVHVVGERLRYRSFPSGHTCTAFAFAMVLGLLYGRWFWLTLLGSGVVAYSRIYMGVHFPLDTIAGAGIAIIAIFTAFRIYQRRVLLQQPDIRPQLKVVSRES
jgi:undecaprenyl-diphosphatase